MVKWLVIGTAVSVGWATAARAQLKGLSSAEIAQSHRIDVDGMDASQCLDDRLARGAPLLAEGSMTANRPGTLR